MQSAIDRRHEIINALRCRHYDTVDNLAFEFSVSASTIKRDLNVLSRSYNIVTKKGKHGGVYFFGEVAEGKSCLKDYHLEFLHRIAKALPQEESVIMNEIIHILESRMINQNSSQLDTTEK